MLSAYNWIPAKAVIECFECYHQLMTLQDEWNDAFDDTDHPDQQVLDDIINWIAKAEECLKANIARVSQMPMAICGNTDFEAKARAITQAMFMAMPDIGRLLQFCRRVVGVTTDRGTELGLANAEGGSVKRYLPNWAGSNKTVTADAGAMDASSLLPEAEEPSQTHLFTRALIATGFIHCIHNLEKDMDKHLKCVPDFLQKYKNLCYVLHRKDVLERFRTRCLPNTRFERADWLFTTLLPDQQEWRWGTIVKGLRHLVKREAVLQHTWCPVKFSNNQAIDVDGLAGTRASKLEMGPLTQTIRSVRFCGIRHLLLALHDLTDACRDWAETCPCHSWLAA